MAILKVNLKKTGGTLLNFPKYQMQPRTQPSSNLCLTFKWKDRKVDGEDNKMIYQMAQFLNPSFFIYILGYTNNQPEIPNIRRYKLFMLLSVDL